METRKQSTTDYPIVFFMVDSSDHITGKTGLSPTVTLSKNGGAFGAAAGSVSEIANGWYSLAGNATDRNTLGPLIIHATATGADSLEMKINIVAYDSFNIPMDILLYSMITPTDFEAAANNGVRFGDMIAAIRMAVVGKMDITGGTTYEAYEADDTTIGLTWTIDSTGRSAPT
jgi:hypothetical protein